MKKEKKSYFIIYVLFFAWIFLIYYLSSQNGPETANTSGRIAVKLAYWLYDKPTIWQINEIHMTIRKIAHVALFAVLGCLLIQIWRTIFKRVHWLWIALGAYGMLFVFAFFDEWHKQFIMGRHKDYGDALLNLLGGTIGIVIMLGITIVKEKKRQEYETSDY